MLDLETEPEFQERLDWMDWFGPEEVEPIDVPWGDKVYECPLDPKLAADLEHKAANL